MRIRALLGGILGSAAVLIIGWQAGAAAAHNASAEASTGSASTGSGSTGSGSSSGSSSTSSGTSSTGTSTSTSTPTTVKDGTYTGDVENTQFGPVQVKVVVTGGKITDVVALQLTDRGGRSVQISDYAAPILRKEVLSAQSAHVSTVSGATYTSEGYLTSLQSALDKAGA